MLCFFASELAAVLGANRYNNQSDALDTVLARVLKQHQEDVLIGDNVLVEWAQPISAAVAASVEQAAVLETMDQGADLVKRATAEAEASVEQKAVEVAKTSIMDAQQATLDHVFQAASTLDEVKLAVSTLPETVQQVWQPVINHVEQVQQESIKSESSESEEVFWHEQKEDARKRVKASVRKLKRAKREAKAEAEQRAVELVKAIVVADQEAAVEQVFQNATTLKDVNQAVAALPAPVKQVLKPVIQRVKAEKVTALKQTVSEINCAFGTAREDTVRTNFARKSHVAVSKDNKFLKRIVGTTSSGCVYGVGGRVDGLDEHDRVIEIKNRTKRFLGLTTYEKPQLFAYMFILRASKAVFIENYNGTSRVLHVDWDDEYWNELITQLHSVAHLVHLLQHDLDVRQEYLTCASSTARTSWIRNHV